MGRRGGKVDFVPPVLLLKPRKWHNGAVGRIDEIFTSTIGIEMCDYHGNRP